MPHPTLHQPHPTLHQPHSTLHHDHSYYNSPTPAFVNFICSFLSALSLSALTWLKTVSTATAMRIQCNHSNSWRESQYHVKVHRMLDDNTKVEKKLQQGPRGTGREDAPDKQPLVQGALCGPSVYYGSLSPIISACHMGDTTMLNPSYFS